MDQNSMLEQMLAQQFGDNPQWQTLFSMMQQRQAERAADLAEQEEKSVASAEKYRVRLENAMHKIRQLKNSMDGMRLHLEELEDFHEEIAHALGACVYCCGQDASCRACKGKGKPGVFEPDPALFQQWIAPVLRRMTPSVKEVNT